MAQTLEQTPGAHHLEPPLTTMPATRRAARADLRRQIANLESELAGLFTAGFPRRSSGIDWKVGAAGGPRVLGVGELEATRDALVARIATVRRQLAERAEREEQSRALVEEMIAEPERHRFVVVSNEHLGEPGCKHFHSRPRFGLIGMLMNWWRVKVSSGCPLAPGRGHRPPPPTTTSV
ncbi:hypothetical protein HJD18_04355 [Thermoleophilia bacterium SCSIO 60948]|nr:hypothetical protein HJD18_04355 [Thermoleophilia bacterium SCSIO 60948]